MQAQRSSLSALPPAPRRRGSFRLGRTLARILCVLFSIIGFTPVLIVFIARTSWAQHWAQVETTKLLDQQGIVAKYVLSVHGFPPSLELDDVVIEANDGGSPVLKADRLAVRPRLFALLSGKLIIDQIEVDEPKTRIVIQDGELQNLSVHLPKSKDDESKPLHLPFDSFAITDGEVDISVEGVRLIADAVDVDVTVQDDAIKGATLETELRIGSGTLHRARTFAGQPEHDDDSICSLESRMRIEPNAISIRRLSLVGSADLDHKLTNPPPPCELPAGDRRLVELTLSHVRVDLPKKAKPGEATPLPRVQGHLKFHLPLALTQRFTQDPETDGWIGADVDVAYDPSKPLPDVKGKLEAGNVRVMQFSFGRSFEMTFDLHGGVLKAEEATLGIADGFATLRNVEVQPLAKGIPVKASVDVRDVSFNSLMHDLSIAKHPWLEWKIKEVHLPLATGTLDPLKIDGDFTAKTPELVVYDGPIEHAGRPRMLHVENADIAAHLAIRPDSLQFRNPHVRNAKSDVQGELVLIGYHGELEVNVPKAHVDLGDIGPLGGTPMTGILDASVRIYPNTSDPKLEADGGVTDLVLGDLPLGTVEKMHAHLDINPPTVLALTGVKAHKGKSEYDMPEGRLGVSKAGVTFDGHVHSAALDLKDLLAVFRLEEDPRFTDFGAIMDTDGSLHVALGGTEDKCGAGFFTVTGGAHLTNVKAFGEEFEEGDVDLDLRFSDRLAGLAGADIDIPSLSLSKVRRTTDKAVIGSVLGSATVQRGGVVHGSAVIEGIPLGRVQALSKIVPANTALEGTMSGIAQLGGTIDAVSFTSDLTLSPIRARGVPLQSSHVRVAYTMEPPKGHPSGRTGCNAPMPPLFDKEAYLHDTSVQGTWDIDGDLFGGQVELSHLHATQQKQAQIAGTVRFKKLDLGAVLAIASWKPATEETNPDESTIKPRGELSGDLLIDRITQGEMGRSRLTFIPGAIWLEQSGRKVSLKKTTSVLSMKNSTVEIEPIELELSTPEGLTGSLLAHGRATHLDGDPLLDIDTELKPVDLGLLVGVVPKLDRASGSLAGTLHIGGRAADPDIDGDVKVRANEIAVHGWPSVISAVELDLKAGRQEIALTRGVAKFAGGSVTVSGRLPVHNLEPGEADFQLVGTGIRLVPADGVSVGIDANLRLTADAKGLLDKRKLPHVTGDIVINDFDYSRPINLSTDILAGRTARTVVDTYDSANDALNLDLTVRARSPLRIHNNLVEAQLSIETGTIAVSGTNQRFGLRGTLRALPGGRFRIPFAASIFDVKSAKIEFSDPKRIAPNVDVIGTTEYRRGGDAMSGAVAAYGASAGASSWRFNMHAYGDPSDLKVEFTSDPNLNQEDIMLLLTVGMTRAEIEQIRGGLAVAGAGAALEALNMTGAGSRLKESINVVDDFRFGSAYSPRTGRSEPQITIGKQISPDVRAQVTTSVAENRELRAEIQFRLNKQFSLRTGYDNVQSQFSPAVGNIGADLRWRLDFE